MNLGCRPAFPEAGKRPTSVRLSDGRELIYYDETPHLDRVQPHPFPRPGRRTAPQLRHDPLLDEWVAYSSEDDEAVLPADGGCPLCPSRDGHRSDIPSASFDVVALEARQTAAGRNEVLVFSSDHEMPFAGLSSRRARLVLDAWADRTSALSGMHAVEQVFCFENRGAAMGATLLHPHGQINAYPFVSPRTRRQLEVARRRRDRTGRNVFADVLNAESSFGARVVLRSECWTAFVPGAARWPVEVHLYPHRQVPDLPSLTSRERDDFCTVYLDLLQRLDRLYDLPMPYIAAWHQAPVHTDRDLAYLHLELFSTQRAAARLKFLAGSESGMGVFINDWVPERVADALRELSATPG